MHILLTNDDGIYSKGIYSLYKALKRIGAVSVIAPEAEQSAVGHAITMSTPLRIKKVYREKRYFGYAVSGTPADCVKIAVRSVLDRKTDLVLSGINLGPNTGFSSLYSGTVSGATEGAIFGIPSIAVSLATYSKPDFGFAASFTAKIAKIVYDKKLPKGTYLNINIPARKPDELKGIKITKQGKAPIIESYDKRIDPRKRTYYWLTGEVMNLKGKKDSDVTALKRGYISITPLHCDLTDYKFIDDMKTWKLKK